MKVATVEGIPVSVPGETGLRRNGSGAFDHVLIRVETRSGTVGWGEVVSMPTWPRGQTQEALLELVGDLVPVVEGRRLGNITATRRTMEETVSRSPFPIAGIEVALHDALGRHLEIPVADLMGGFHRPDRSIDLHASIPPGSEEAVSAAAEEAVNAGFTDVKVKVGTGHLSDDLRTVRSVRDFIPEARIRVDANGAWTATEAVHALQELDEAADGLAYAEQPVSPGAMDQLTRLRRQTTVPILADESCFSAADVHALASAGAVDAVSIKVAKAGGLQGARDAATVAEAAGVGSLVGGMLELGIGTAASAHLAAAMPNLHFPTGIFAHPAATVFLENADGWTPSEPQFRVPDAPGLGIDVDEAAIEQYRTD